MIGSEIIYYVVLIFKFMCCLLVIEYWYSYRWLYRCVLVLKYCFFYGLWIWLWICMNEICFKVILKMSFLMIWWYCIILILVNCGKFIVLMMGKYLFI